MFAALARPLLLIAAALALHPLHTHGATAGPSRAAGAQQVTLSEDLVKRFLASYPELKALGKRYESEVPKRPDAKGPLEALSGYMRHQKARTAFQSVLSKHGFSDFPSWIGVAQSVALAYGYVKSGRTAADLSAQTGQAMARIWNNPRLSPAQKQQMMAMMKRQQGMVARFQPSPENLAVVRRMLPGIAAVMDSP